MEWAALTLIFVVYGAMWLAVHPLDNTPVLDDWVYALSVKSILETGRFALPSPSSANFIVQGYWGALFCLPFGLSFEALRVSTFAAGVGGLIAFYFLLRELGGERSLSTIGALTLAANPVYFRYSVSFMTEVPFVALCATGFFFFVRGARSGNNVVIMGAYVTALLAIMVRQFGLVLPLSFGIAHLLRTRLSRQSVAIAVVPVLAGVMIHVGYQRWLIATGRTPLLYVQMSNLLPANYTDFSWRVKSYATAMLPYFGFLAAPLVVSVLLTRQIWLAPSRFIPIALLLGVAILGMTWVKGVGLNVGPKVNPGFPNSMTQYGVGPLFIRDSSDADTLLVYPIEAVIWRVATVFSCFVTAALGVLAAGLVPKIVAAFSRGNSSVETWSAALMLSAAASYVVGLLLFSNASQIHDRYLLFLVIPISGFAVSSSFHKAGFSRKLPALALSAILVTSIGLFSVLATHDYMAWNRARWRATDYLAEQGIPPTKVDGGYEYNNWVMFDPHATPPFANGWYPVFDDEYLITIAPMPGYEVVRQFSFSHWLWPDSSSVDVLHRINASSRLQP